MPSLRSRRKYPRITFEGRVLVEGMNIRCDAICVELSAGGMALENADHLSVSLPIQITFTVPPDSKITLDAVVWWKQGKRIGVRFDPGDANRLVVDQFVEAHASKAG